MKVKRITWSEAVDLCYKLAEKISSSGYVPDGVVAVLRGGVLPALIISDYLGVSSFYAARVKHWGVGGEVFKEPVIEWVSGDFYDKKLLVVDEVVDTGKTLEKVVHELIHRGAHEVRTAVLHVKPTTIYMPNYYVEKLNEWVWIFYPWSLIETMYNLSRSGEDVSTKALEFARRLNIEDSLIEYVRRGIVNYLKKKQ